MCGAVRIFLFDVLIDMFVYVAGRGERHNSGRLLWYNDVPYHPGDSYADAGVFICVSSWILFVCVTISTL